MAQPAINISYEMAEEFENLLDHMADEKIVQLSKIPGANLDKKAIRVSCEKELSTKIEAFVNEDINHCQQFYEQLKSENPIIYEKLSIPMKNLSDRNLNKFTQTVLEDSDKEAIKNYGIKLSETDWGKAYDCFLFLSHVDSQNPIAWQLKGISEHNLGKYEEALDSYSNALRLAPGYMYAHTQYVKCLWDAGKTAEAKERLDFLAKEFGSNPDVQSLKDRFM